MTSLLDILKETDLRVGSGNPIAHAAARSYSWSKPPSRSRRQTAPPGQSRWGGGPSGGRGRSARCGRAAL
jgi:hypothetical protein